MKTKVYLSIVILISTLLLSNDVLAQWKQMTDMPTGRVGHKSCVLDGKIYVMGGSDTREGPAFDNLEVYDPILDQWETKASMLFARANFGVCVWDGKIYAIGGGQSFFWDPMAYIEAYDPISDTWTYITDMPVARMGLSACLINGKIYIIGGANAQEISYGQVDVWDPVSDIWTTAADLPIPRFSLQSVVLEDKIYTIGGHIGPPWNGLRHVHEYDPVADKWTTKADLLTGRKYSSSCVLDNKIYMVAGSIGPGNYISSVEEYDQNEDAWVKRTEVPTILAAPSASAFNGKIYVFGGTDKPPATATVFSSVYEYDPTIGPAAFHVLSRYVRSSGDTLKVIAQLDPEFIPASVYAEITGEESASEEKINLFDDGLHEDSEGGDGLWAGSKWLSGLEEDDYSVKLFTNDFATGIIEWSLFENYFTTKGPIQIESFFLDLPNENVIRLQDFTLKNLGSVKIINNIFAEITSSDTCVEISEFNKTNFGNLAPGESKSVELAFGIIRHSCAGIIEFEVEISSGGIVFWTELITVDLTTDVRDEIGGIPQELELEQNYPNPFNPSTVIKYSLPKPSKVTLKVFDVLGGKVTTLVNDEQTQGYYEVEFDAAGLSSGIYFYRLQAGVHIETKRMVLLR